MCAVGSSRSSTSGSSTSALAIASLCFKPVDSVSTLRSLYSSKPTSSSARRARLSTSSGDSARFSPGKYTSSITVGMTYWDSGSWKTTPTVPAKPASPSSAGKRPATLTSPSTLAGMSEGMAPANVRRSVVLPLPVGPTTSTNSPLRASNETSLST
jgi:hypothetical protein